MKTTAFFLVTLIVGSLASPSIPSIFSKGRVHEATNERIVTGQIIAAIEAAAQQIRDAGLDPFELDAEVSYELPVAVIFSAEAILDRLEIRGLSNIVVHSMNFSVIQSRLTFNIGLPGLSLSLGNAEAKVVLFGKDLAGAASGSLNINNIRVAGDIRINIGIISGISVRSLSLQFSLGGIVSALNIEIVDRDLSEKINTLLGTTIPTTLTEFASEINELIEAVAWRIINETINSPNFFW